jgi:hypothetical protein
MAPRSSKPTWTKDDSHLCLQMAVVFIGFSALLGWLSGEGLLWGAAGGAGLWGIITAGALISIAYKRLRS